MQPKSSYEHNCVQVCQCLFRYGLAGCGKPDITACPGMWELLNGD